MLQRWGSGHVPIAMDWSVTADGPQDQGLQIDTRRRSEVGECILRHGTVSGFAVSNMARRSFGFLTNSPFDRALASFEHAAPPRPLRAGAPAWISPGRLRRPLKGNIPRIATSKHIGRCSAISWRQHRPAVASRFRQKMLVRAALYSLISDDCPLAHYLS